MMERMASGRGGGQRLPSENEYSPDKRGLGASDGQQSSGLLNFGGFLLIGHEQTVCLCVEHIESNQMSNLKACLYSNLIGSLFDCSIL